MKIKLYMSNGESIMASGDEAPKVLGVIGQNKVVHNTDSNIYVNMAQVVYVEVIEYDD